MIVAYARAARAETGLRLVGIEFSDPAPVEIGELELLFRCAAC